MIPDNTIEKVHLANDVGQDLKKAWLQGAVDFGTKKEPAEFVATLPTPVATTTRDWGQPPFETPYSDIRKVANPHSSDYYTVGAVSPSRWSNKFK